MERKGLKENMEKMSRKERVREMKAIHEDEQEPIPTATVAPARNLREAILRMSLFPNIYNRRCLLAEG